VNIINDSPEYRIYLGRRVPQKLGKQEKEDITVLARSCDMLLSCGVTAGLEAFGQAKANKAKGYVWMHPSFITDASEEASCSATILAYEHAISAVVTDDDPITHSMAAEGFPPSKFQSTTRFLGSLDEGDISIK